MSILERYVIFTLIKATLLIVLIFVGFEIFVLLASQLNSVGKGSYTIWQAIVYVILLLPQQTYLLFPIVGLLGMLFGFSWLANHSELIIMRAAGVSPLQILRYAMQAGLWLVIVMVFIGEFFAPSAKLLAEKRKLAAISTGQALKTSSGVWLRQDDNFYYIKTIYSMRHIANISRYAFAHQQLITASVAREGRYIGGVWQMSDIKESHLTNQAVTSTFIPSATWYLPVDPHLLRISQRFPEEMSLRQLSDLIEYQKRNHLIGDNEQIKFWQRVFQPISMLVMMFLALPFVFGSLRSMTTSLRLVLGVIVGFAFYLCNQLFPSLSEVLNFSPIIAALLPSIVFVLIGVILFRRI